MPRRILAQMVWNSPSVAYWGHGQLPQHVLHRDDMENTLSVAWIQFAIQPKPTTLTDYNNENNCDNYNNCMHNIHHIACGQLNRMYKGYIILSGTLSPESDPGLGLSLIKQNLTDYVTESHRPRIER
jgi:hypothetical protein